MNDAEMERFRHSVALQKRLIDRIMGMMDELVLTMEALKRSPKKGETKMINFLVTVLVCLTLGGAAVYILMKMGLIK